MDTALRQDVNDSVDRMRDRLVETVVESVQIESVTPTYPGIDYDEVLGGETEVNEYYRPLLEDLGFETTMIEVEEGRSNLVGTLEGSGGGSSLVFQGHVDVVPPGDEEKWEKDPFSGIVTDGRVWGRGSCDMKSGNAAVITAVEALQRNDVKLKGDLLVHFVVGEEMMNTEAGAGAPIEAGYTANAGINVEPSAPPHRLGLITVSPGVQYLRITIPGKAVHASMRDELVRAGGRGEEIGVHSIDKAWIIYRALNELEEKWGRTKDHPLYDRPGHFTIHPGVITGGPNGPFIVSDESVLECAVWYPPDESAEEIQREVEEHVHRYVETDDWLRDNPPEMEWLLNWPPFEIDPDEPIARTVAESYETVLDEPAPFHGFAAVDDATFLNDAGVPTLTLGPGNLEQAHTANEYVEIDQVVDASKIYAQSMMSWCGVA